MVYTWGWAICLAATLVVIACGWWFTRKWKPLLLRDLVRIFAIVTLLVPVTAGPSEGFFAPAYIVLIFEAFLQAEGDPADALAALSLAWALGLVVLIAVTLWRRLRARA
ncbi:MAG TPA: hypothetical protein VLA56_06755 [Pseudomonadales bacterium]|nr:hypothetical protein [Pseudomonadales bacterium]